MNAMDGTNRRSRGVGKAAVAHKRLQRLADYARGDYASNQIFEDEGPFTPVPHNAHRAAIDQLVRDEARRGIRSVV
jgi:hypothetical protein